MSAMLPEAVPCCNPCSESTLIQVPGATGAAGTAGTNGTNGVSAFTTTTSSFVMPAEGASVVVAVANTSWMALLQILFVQTAGWMRVAAIGSATSVTLTNLESAGTSAYLENAAPTTVIASGVKVCPGGLQGPAGSTVGGLLAANNLSDVANVATSRTNLGLGSLSTQGAGAVMITGGAVGVMTDVATAATIRTNIGAQTLDATLTSLAGLGTVADRYAYTTAIDTWAEGTITAAGRAILDDADAAAQRTTLGLNRTLQDYILIREEQATGVDGGTFTSGAWRTRALNTETVDTGSHAAVAASQVTLQAGTYRFRGWTVGYDCDNHQCRLQNITAGTTVAFGSNNRSKNTDAGGHPSLIEGRFTIAAATVFELQHRCQTTKATNGLGLANSFGGTEVYASILFEREAS